MPIAPAHNPLKIALVGGAAVVSAATIVSLVFDPTHGAAGRLGMIEQVQAATHAKTDAPPPTDAAGLANTPIFIMTSGPSAYKEKAFVLYGISMSPKRKAALIVVDGGEPKWVAVGETVDDVRLSDVGTNGASFETPIGPRTVGLSDATSEATDKTPAQKGPTGQ